MIIIAAAAAYLFSALGVFGFFYAFLQDNWPRISDRRSSSAYALLLSLLYGVLGPLGVFLAWVMTEFGRYGWRLK